MVAGEVLCNSPPHIQKKWWTSNMMHLAIPRKESLGLLTKSGARLVKPSPRLPPFLFFGLRSVQYTEAEECVLYWAQTEEQKRGRPGNEARCKTQTFLLRRTGKCQLCFTGQLEWLFSHCKLSDMLVIKSRANKPSLAWFYTSPSGVIWWTLNFEFWTSNFEHWTCKNQSEVLCVQSESTIIM